ncbi:aminodeoxychorismate synthase component I [Qipengyuania sp. DGS5-3]|uniref:aminodeoxychorismate synthase component I n=1 Tax=Qipengyuania sp. DGS5-3 TaxID=3349632 RepID=UPI0036D23D9B
MGERSAIVLLDDARSAAGDASVADALLYSEPRQIFVAHRPDQVSDVLHAADAAQAEHGAHLAGYIAYEAGLALEERLAPLANPRTGADGPLVWLGLFDEPQVIPASEVSAWLAEQSGGPNARMDARVGPLEPAISQGAYIQAFDTLQEAIRAGDIYQANLTLPLAGAFSGDPLALYAALRPAAQAGYGGLIYDGSHWLLSLSPELFVSLKEGEAKAKPMKGTRPRGRDEAEDQALAQALAGSEKDKAENLMIVDLLRNDLSRVAEPGSVQVDEPFKIESYPTVHQMVSTVRADLGGGHGAHDLVRAMFPCGSITGAPKIRAMELLTEVERDPRGPYCGAIGRIDAPDKDGRSDAAFNVAIRTLRLTEIENGNGKAVLGVGGAIVADSDQQTEWREAIVKGSFARASSDTLTAPGFDLIETMRFEPETGIAHLELHLERMKASALELGFAFDRHAARNQLHALCFDLDNAARVRLVASRSGEIALEAAPLPPAWGDPARCIILPIPVDPGDWRLRHKTSDRGFYEDARSVAQQHGADEALFVRPDGLLTEGTITNVFVQAEDGTLRTPAAALGLLPGIQRQAMLTAGAAREAEVRVDDLANGFSLANSLRGVMPAKLI